MPKKKSKVSFKGVLLSLLPLIFCLGTVFCYAWVTGERIILWDGSVRFDTTKLQLYLWVAALSVSLVGSGLYFLLRIHQSKPMNIFSWIVSVSLGLATFLILLLHMFVSIKVFQASVFSSIIYFVLPFVSAGGLVFVIFVFIKNSLDKKKERTF